MRPTLVRSAFCDQPLPSPALASPAHFAGSTHCAALPSRLVLPRPCPAQPNSQIPRFSLCFRGRPCASTCLQCAWLTEEGPAGSRPTPVTFPTARLRAFVREREKRRALLYKKHNLVQVR